MMPLLTAAATVPHPVLHERLPPNSSEDLRLRNKIPYGGLPAAVRTPSGVALAPNAEMDPTQSTSAYGGSSSGDQRNRFRPDLDTRRPSVSMSNDVFSPSVSPYERLYIYDSVLDDFSLAVRHKQLTPVPWTTEKAANEDTFFADITVDISSDNPVRIPSVGASARLLRLVTQPQATIRILHDGADNWYVRGVVNQRVRLMMQVAVRKEAFGGDFQSVLRDTSPSFALPKRVKESVQRVVGSLDLAQNAPAMSTLLSLISYFRGFSPTDSPLQEHGNIYEQLVLSQKGVCRHRAYAFLVTALGLGYHVRLVANEAHAWVEVQGVDGWKRIDLGGASQIIERKRADTDGRAVPAYQSLPDAFPWANKRRTTGEASLRASAPPSSSATGAIPARSHMPASGSLRRPRRAGRVIISSIDRGRIRRGASLRVQGKIVGGSQLCNASFVDISLLDQRRGTTTKLGAVAISKRGSFEGAVVVPLVLPLGAYTVVGTSSVCREGGATNAED